MDVMLAIPFTKRTVDGKLAIPRLLAGIPCLRPGWRQTERRHAALRYSLPHRALSTAVLILPSRGVQRHC
eukprot:362362-Chlamydomonas_euryale.AAC.2